MILTIDLFDDCNLKCIYCYQKQKGCIPVEKVNELVDYYSPRILNIGGGEPFMYDELNSLIKENVGKVKELNIATNATKINDYEILKNPGIVVQVSLPSLIEYNYEKITKKNKLDNVLLTINELIEEGVRTSINSVIVKNNFDEVGELISYAKDKELSICINPAHPINGGEGWLLSDEQVISLRDLLFSEKIVYESVESVLLHPLDCSNLKKKYSFFNYCKITSKVYISPNLKKYSCEFLKKSDEK